MYPLKIYWNISDDPNQASPARLAISVPRKKFRRAVDRNLLKRRIRESYRLNKNLVHMPLLEKQSKIEMIILFLSDEFISFERLNNSTCKILVRLAENLP